MIFYFILALLIAFVIWPQLILYVGGTLLVIVLLFLILSGSLALYDKLSAK